MKYIVFKLGENVRGVVLTNAVELNAISLVHVRALSADEYARCITELI